MYTAILLISSTRSHSHKLNIDQNSVTPSKYGVRGIPTLLLFKDGNVVDTKVGALSKTQLKEFLDKNS